MKIPFFKSKRRSDTIPALYNAIVAQSRQPVFFAEWGVPDTVTGRFDMVSLHMALVLRRLRREGETTKEFAQQLFDWFFKDMDRSLRELGVGDTVVPKKIGDMGGLFYGLLGALTEALDSGDEATLRAVLARNVQAEGHDDPDGPEAGRLAGYVRRLADGLDATDAGPIMAGEPVFGDAA